MKFSDFKSVEQVIAKYPLARKKTRFLPNTTIEPSEWFIEDIDFALSMQTDVESEMYFRECFIFPFIRYIWKRYPTLKLWVNRNLAYKDELTGESDYFISQHVESVTSKIVGKPLLVVLEAKQEKFTEGWGQCLAEMIACQKLNDADEIVIYGIVSTGEFWQFGKLKHSTFTRNLYAYSIREPSYVLGALDYVFGECEKQLTNTS